MILTNFLPFCRFREEKLHPVDTSQDAVLLLRNISGQKMRPVAVRDNRPHLVAESVTFVGNEGMVSMGSLSLVEL